MKDISREIFRQWEPAQLFGKDGSIRTVRGLVVRERSCGVDGPGKRHESGVLEEPRYLFTGWVDQAAPGDVLAQNGQRYTVLEAEFLRLGSRRVAGRLVLEREVAAGDGS